MWSVMMFVEVRKIPGPPCLMLPVTLSHCLSALGKVVWLSRPNTLISHDRISILKTTYPLSWTFLLPLFKNKIIFSPFVMYVNSSVLFT